MALKHFRKLTLTFGANYQSKTFGQPFRKTLVSVKSYSDLTGGEDPEKGRTLYRLETVGGSRGCRGSHAISGVVSKCVSQFKCFRAS